MRLGFEKIKEITVGATEIWQEKDGVHFSKLTKTQAAAWASVVPDILHNIKITTGVRLDFHTDSPFVKFEVVGGRKFEVKTDERLTHRFVLEKDEKPATLEIPLGNAGEMKRVTFTLPSHTESDRIDEGILKDVEVADGATVVRHKFDKKILFLGDSITQGWNSKYDSLSFAYLVSDFFNAESVIQGIGCGRFDERTVEDFGFDPDMVFVAFGTNDFGAYKTMNEFRPRVEAYLKKVRITYPRARIFVISPVWRTDYDIPKEAGTFAEHCNVIKTLALQEKLELIDGDKLVPPHEDFMADRLHPNDLGFTMYALNLLKALYRKEKL